MRAQQFICTLDTPAVADLGQQGVEHLPACMLAQIGCEYENCGACAANDKLKARCQKRTLAKDKRGHDDVVGSTKHKTHGPRQAETGPISSFKPLPGNRVE